MDRDENSVPQYNRSPAVARKAGRTLSNHREEITRRWLIETIEDLDLESLQSFPSMDLAKSFPAFVTSVARNLAEPEGSTAAPGSEEFAALLAGIHKGRFDLDRVFDDYRLLKSLILEVAVSELRSTDVETLVTFQRLEDSMTGFFKSCINAFINEHSQDLERLAHTDPLTGLFNRRHLHHKLQECVDIHKRYQVPFTLMMLDVDRLKQLNDSFGHQAGDRALRHLAAIMQSEKRTTDTASRYGGDEFVLLLPGTQSPETSASIARRIVEKVEDISRKTGGREMTSVSIGIGSCPLDGTEAEPLLDCADRALYRAKASGSGSIATSSRS